MSELLDKVNWIDIFALILLIRISYVSSLIGVGKQILPLIVLVLILLGALYNYSNIAFFLVEGGFFSPSASRFLSYFFILCVSFVIYRVVSQVAGFCLFRREEEKAGLIESIGGALLGLLRSILIVGMIIIGLGFAPVKVVEDSVKDSYSGTFFISTNLRLYNSIISFIFRGDEKAHQRTLSGILFGKEKYIFNPLDVKKKSRFFKDNY